ncbi:hypothetical protein MD588_24205 [Photobacterium sp. SDRW27]|uniref:hypothetical protein n=1 Tax=Photobacterium obscurum TaxID=2829490 RepID=UPI002244B5D7|nr:hypothetical protein [Photobacterium obscurum]MCW8331907.1 hypothetical protein [Photobacterium obscurum]
MHLSGYVAKSINGVELDTKDFKHVEKLFVLPKLLLLMVAVVPFPVFDNEKIDV